MPAAIKITYTGACIVNALPKPKLIINEYVLVLNIKKLISQVGFYHRSLYSLYLKRFFLQERFTTHNSSSDYVKYKNTTIKTQNNNKKKKNTAKCKLCGRVAALRCLMQLCEVQSHTGLGV